MIKLGANERLFVIDVADTVRGTERERMSVALVSPRDRWIAGVCSGLARRFGRSPNFVRLLFVVSCLLPGPQFLLYLILWIIMPSE